MSDDLVDQLAKRLFDIGAIPIEAGPLWWSEATDECREMFRRQAREVIRLMEWARSNCVLSVDSFDAGNSWLDNLPLTLPPPEWKP